MINAPKAVAPSVNGWNAEYLDQQYSRWKADPASIPADLAGFFYGFELAGQGARLASVNGAPPVTSEAPGAPAAPGVADARKQAAVTDMIQDYRNLGHLAAAIDPFGRERTGPASLHPSHHGLTDADMEARFDAGSLSPDGSPMTLRAIVDRLNRTYCGSIGAEFSHVSDTNEWNWLRDRLESSGARANLDRTERAHILYQLHRAELFEKFCGKRYVGVKRFSLEGGETLIPCLDAIVEKAGQYDVQEIVFGMAHRGRLNVLTNIIGKTFEQIFTEFDDSWTEDSATGGGDVKYHRGYSSNRLLNSGRNIWVCMASNPSHLESVNPVVLGRCRAKQRLIKDYARERIIPVLIHGDAAVIGQGVVAEALNMSHLEGYWVGGAVHVVINNLIGFTTGEDDARSCRYCTDLAKAIEAPVLHVNGEDPEAAVFAARLAMDYRMTFKKDIFIDIVCYRRHGHNETDEAAFTQPLLYAEISKKKSPVVGYAQALMNEKVITADDVKQIEKSLDEELDNAFKKARATPVDPTPDPGHRHWEGFTGRFTFDRVDTGVAREALDEVAKAAGRWPEGFTPHSKLAKTLGDRARCVREDLPIDWGTAEALAVGSLMLEGKTVRLTGQDSRRGTFSHRHAALRDVNTGDLFVPLSHMNEEIGAHTIRRAGPATREARALEGRYWVYDSPLSEFAVVGFEYGFSLVSPNLLTMWEAQFGDFCNGAQTIIDQYMAAGEAKWQRWSGLVLLLPHGYEGAGPEHSSCRLERFLQLCAEENMQVCHPTTPAQYFHLLRRQVSRRFRKPLIIATPKSLLRAPHAASRIEELLPGALPASEVGFREVIDDPAFSVGEEKWTRENVKRVILCSGKVYYDLVKRRSDLSRRDIAIVRVEQLYPLHLDMLTSVIGRYPGERELVWAQEEPRNAGAWQHMAISLMDAFGWELPYIGRPASSTPATGSPRKHAEQLEEFLSDAIGPLPPELRGKGTAAAH